MKKKPEQNIGFQFKLYLKYRYFHIALLIVMMTSFFFCLLKLIKIEKEMLFWLFSATSQSMAAMFAVVGMFAVFRLQAIENRLKDHKDVLKNKFKSREWNVRFGELDVDCWRYNEILRKARGRLKVAKERYEIGDFPYAIMKDLIDRIKEISDIERLRTGIAFSLIIPMVSILITFMVAIVSLPLSGALSINFSKYVILLFILVLITFSSVSIYKFFKVSMNPKWERK